MGEWTLRTSVTIVLCFLLLIAKFRKFGSRPDNLPPGPPTLPILGICPRCMAAIFDGCSLGRRKPSFALVIQERPPQLSKVG